MKRALVTGGAGFIGLHFVENRTRMLGEFQRGSWGTSMAGRELDWAPEVGLEGGLKQTYDWSLENTA